MPGAIALSASAAARAGAGYVRVSTSKPIAGLPHAIVQTDSAPVNDDRIGCLLVGPGMGDVPQVLTLAMTSRAPKVIDADGISHLGEPERLRGQDAIITPHEGEFRSLFGDLPGSKAERALAAAANSGAVVVYKGPDTLVASPDGRLGFAPPAPAWLASAGTGDVLAGMIAAMRATGLARLRGAQRRRLVARPGCRDRWAGDDRRRPVAPFRRLSPPSHERSRRPDRGARGRRDCEWPPRPVRSAGRRAARRRGA